MTEFLDRPPPGWFVLDVLRREPRKWNWCALMIDVDPDDFVEGWRKGRRNYDAAWNALEDLMATRH